MLFRDQSSTILAISQPTHAWISGQILRAWDEPLGEALLLAAEQHDLAWIDWETAPSFDPESGRPHLFRDIGAAVHAPMWAHGVERALGAWGAHVALLISRHGGVIYRRFKDRHRVAEEDAVAAQRYLDTQAALESTWSRTLGLDSALLDKETALLALADTISLAVCGELKVPLSLEAPSPNGDLVPMQLSKRPGQAFTFIVSPWPFRSTSLTVEGEARPIPPGGRLSSEAAMRSWLASPERVLFRADLTPSG
jgi:Protein of unknown function (DUF3891)